MDAQVFTCDGADADLAHVGERHRLKDLAIPITGSKQDIDRFIGRAGRRRD